MYPFFAERLIYPLGDLALGTSVIEYYHWLQKTQWWTQSQLQELQSARLRALIEHAYKNVPYYRRIFENRGLTDRDIQNTDDLLKLPVLTKSDIRQNSTDMLAENYRKWRPIANSTGGSTGEPLKYYITKDMASISWAGNYRGWGWAGYRIGDKRISFGGSSLVPNKTPSKFEIVRRKLERNLPLSAVSMNNEKYDRYVKMIRKYRPGFIYGYPSSLYLFSEYCNDFNIRDVKFEAVLSTAEVLLPKYRSAIENQFQCKVFNEYGSYDGGVQAMECEMHDGFHISVEKAVLEVVDESGQKVPVDEPGRVIVTDLYNYAMPFIRYEVGDIGTLTDKLCPCGRGLPLLKALVGRTTDIIKLSNGISLAGPSVTLMFKDCQVKQYQLVQTGRDELLVKVVKGKDYSEHDTNYFMGILKHQAGEGIKIKLEFHESIPAERNNKYRYVISKI